MLPLSVKNTTWHSFLAGALVLAGSFGSACTDGGAAPDFDVPPATPRPGGVVAARYEVELHPRQGRVVAHRLDAVTGARRFDFDPDTCDNDGCTNEHGSIDLFTDPATVTYVEDADGV